MSNELTTGVEIHTFKVVGVTPVMMHSDKSMLGNGKSESGGAKASGASKPKKGDVEKYVYRNADGVLYAPSMWFRACIMGAKSGATGMKIGGKSAPGIFQASVFTVEKECPLFHPETGDPITEYEIHESVVNNQQKGRFVMYRPMIRNWACLVNFEVDTEILGDLSNLIAIFRRAGKVAGVGSWRVNKMGEFGRFTVEPYGHTADVIS